MTVQELAMPKTNAFILDAREKEEYSTSHLKNAIFVGHTTFELDSVLTKIPNKNSEIVVYCSIGIRSETIASKLKKAGYSNVFNLYGGIFEWKNNNFAHACCDSQSARLVNNRVWHTHWGAHNPRVDRLTAIACERT